jgi:ubiquinone/menaquinone biosynthesis C-methylase UbiE
LFAGLPSNYDRLANLLSLGQDPRWRRCRISRTGKVVAMADEVFDGSAAARRPSRLS